MVVIRIGVGFSVQEQKITVFTRYPGFVERFFRLVDCTLSCYPVPCRLQGTPFQVQVLVPVVLLFSK